MTCVRHRTWIMTEVVAECRAQLDRCLDILSRVPDVGVDSGRETPFRLRLRTFP